MLGRNIRANVRGIALHFAQFVLWKLLLTRAHSLIHTYMDSIYVCMHIYIYMYIHRQRERIEEIKMAMENDYSKNLKN